MAHQKVKSVDGKTKDSIMEKMKKKFIPGYKKIKDDTAKSEEKKKYFDSVYDAIKKERYYRTQHLPKLYKNGKANATPAEHNEIMQKYNNDPEVRKLKDTINTYKIRQRTGQNN